MRSYTKTYTFSLFDKEFHIMSRITELKLHRTFIEREPLDIHILNIDKSIKIEIKRQVLADYNAGLISMYIVDDNYTFPSSIPILLEKDPNTNKLKAIINITNYATINRDQLGKIESIDINDNLLFTYMCTAWFYRRWASDEARFNNNANLVKLAASMYSKILFKVLDVKYSIGVDYSSIDQSYTALAYFFAKYFTDSKYAADIACSVDSIMEKSTARELSMVVGAKYPSFENFNGMIDMINKCVHGASGRLDALTFISEFGRLFGGQGIPGLDYLPFFVMIIISAYISGGVCKDLVINSLIRSNSSTFIKLLSDTYR